MKPKMTTLKNGLRILTIPMQDNPTVTVMVTVQAGTRYETRETNGLSHFLEHMCFKGTEKRKSLDIAYELESLGAETNAFTSHDYTGYYAKGRAETLPQLLDVVSDVYLNSTFPEVEIEKERGVILGEIDMYEDLPHRKVQELMNEALYGDQPAGYTTLGPKENIKKFSRADFIRYHEQHYIAPKTIVVVAGHCEPQAVVRLVTRAFVQIKTGRVLLKKKAQNREGDFFIQGIKKTDQAHITLGLRSCAADHKDVPALGLAVGILGQGMSSRLFTKLREEMGAGYYVRASMSASDDCGDIVIATGTDPMRVPEVIKAIRDTIQPLTQTVVSPSELLKQKEYSIGALMMGLETSDAVAGYFVHQALLGLPLKTPTQIIRELRSVTPHDILRVSKKYLKVSKSHLALIGGTFSEQEYKSLFSS